MNTYTKGFVSGFFLCLSIIILIGAPISIIIERQRKKPDTNPFVYVFMIELLILNKC